MIMIMTISIALLICSLSSFLLLIQIQCQQPYEGLSITDCGLPHNSTSLLGYLCNGHTSSCQSFLTFHSQPPYQSVSSISSLLASSPSLLSKVNSVPQDYTFPANTKLIVPVTCSCSGAYSQANSTYVVQSEDTPLTIANNTLQGLSTCQALKFQNSAMLFLSPGMKLRVPLRCACPTTRQRGDGDGVSYLLSYLVEPGDTVFLIGQKFGVNFTAILDANGLSQTNAGIYPYTTLLIPLKHRPNSSVLAVPSPPPASPSPPPTRKRSNHHVGLYIGVALAVVLFLIILSSALVLYLRLKFKRKKKIAASRISTSTCDDNDNSKRPDHQLFTDVKLSESFRSRFSDIGRSLKVYKYQELLLMTQNFSSKCKIGGSVYMGTLKGDFAAVKMITRDVTNEIEILKKINHFNLIRLSGLCFNHGHWFLVYEYAHHGSLSNRLFDQGAATTILSWIQRVQIALDVANGLDYLHSYSDPPYVHKDIKSSNILLDDKFRAKIANFGLARPAQGKGDEFELTRHIVGTQGYMAPEYLEHGLVSPKLDVYAFGIVMLEIITGRDAVTLHKGEDGFSVNDFIAVLLTEEEGDEDEMKDKFGRYIDPLMEGDYPLDSVLFMARLVGGCLRKDAASRLNMGEIVQSLSKLYASSMGRCSL